MTSPAVDWQTITAAAGTKGIHAGSRESLLQLAARGTADDGRRPMSPLQYAILVTLTLVIVLMMLMAVLG